MMPTWRRPATTLGPPGAPALTGCEARASVLQLPPCQGLAALSAEGLMHWRAEGIGGRVGSEAVEEQGAAPYLRIPSAVATQGMLYVVLTRPRALCQQQATPRRTRRSSAEKRCVTPSSHATSSTCWAGAGSMQDDAAGMGVCSTDAPCTPCGGRALAAHTFSLLCKCSSVTSGEPVPVSMLVVAIAPYTAAARASRVWAGPCAHAAPALCSSMRRAPVPRGPCRCGSGVQEPWRYTSAPPGCRSVWG
jgi:hypothetical protein